MIMNYALITGASSGIGYEIALLFAKNGYNLVLVSRQKNKLMQIAKDFESNYNIKVTIIAIDLSDTKSAEKIYKLLHEKSISVKYLVNNAGFYVKGAFSETSWQDELNLIQLQCITHTQLTKMFLSDMLKQGKGGILNIASTGSFVPGPYNAVYCAAKSFVLSFSEAVAEEVSSLGITVTALCPGGTKTEFQQFDKSKRSVLFPIMEAPEVAKTGFNALMNNKRVVIPGFVNKMQVMISQFIPRKLVVKLTAMMVEK